jgi:hypothetical protein
MSEIFVVVATLVVLGLAAVAMLFWCRFCDWLEARSDRKHEAITAEYIRKNFGKRDD